MKQQTIFTNEDITGIIKALYEGIETKEDQIRETKIWIEQLKAMRAEQQKEVAHET